MPLSDQRWWKALSPRTRRRLLTVLDAGARARRPRWGNLRRKRPFSEVYGFDRGKPVDRVYIERFLRRKADAITGDVLEVKSADYTTRFGTEVVRSHVVDIDPTNQTATLIGDICDRETLPVAAFDCVILTQTLQFVHDPASAMGNVWTSLRPGGTALITVPCMGRLDPDLEGSDLWRWTPQGLGTLLAATAPEATVELEAGGNLVASLATLLGLASQDLRPSDIAEDDPTFPVTACAAVRKPEPRGNARCRHEQGDQDPSDWSQPQGISAAVQQAESRI
jgi:SAM-dependent methyltransferase